MTTVTVHPFAPPATQFVMVHNYIFDAVMPDLPPNAWKILCFILRKTRGWNKDDDLISYTQIIDGTGITSPATVKRNLDILIDKDYILAEKEAGETTRYRLNLSFAVEIEQTTTETVVDHYRNCSGTTTETVVTKDILKDKEKHIGSPDGEPLADLLAQATLGVDDTKRLLAAWDAGTLVAGRRLNPTAIVGKLFERRFGSPANFSRIAGLVRAARDYRDATDDVSIDDWYMIAEVIDSSARPHGNVYDYLSGRFKNRSTDAGETRREAYWCVVFDHGERIAPGKRREDPPARAETGSAPSRRVLKDEGEIIKAWWLCKRDSGGWVEVTDE